jgi:hypothetical protein
MGIKDEIDGEYLEIWAKELNINLIKTKIEPRY